METMVIRYKVSRICSTQCYSLPESYFEAVYVGWQRGPQIRSQDTKDLVPAELLTYDESADMPLYDPQPLTQFLILSNEEVRLPERTNGSLTPTLPNGCDHCLNCVQRIAWTCQVGESYFQSFFKKKDFPTFPSLGIIFIVTYIHQKHAERQQIQFD